MEFGKFLKSIVDRMALTDFFVGNGWQRLVMIVIGCVFLFLAIKKDFEPYLLIPIAFGIILVNLFPNIYISADGERGLLGYLHLGVECELYP